MVFRTKIKVIYRISYRRYHYQSNYPTADNFAFPVSVKSTIISEQKICLGND